MRFHKMYIFWAPIECDGLNSSKTHHPRVLDKMMAEHGVNIENHTSCKQLDNCSCCEKPELLPNDEEDDEFAAGLLSRVRGVKPRGKAPAIQWPMVICSTM